MVTSSAAIGRRMLRGVLLLCVLGALAIPIAGCGSSSSSSSAGGGAAASVSTSGASSIKFAKTKFVLHAGLAFGAFHRWIYKPLRAGYLAHPFSHKLTVIKAALATGFVVHELRLALTDAKADPTLAKLVAPITAMQQRFSSAVSGIKSGNADSAGLESVNSAISSLKSQASSAGQSIGEQTPAAP